MSKMKTKSKKVIAPIKIKEEKTANTELKELSFYVDDRVALMQQVFMTIRPKKLKSMAPDCLKDLDINQIKELCLDEILGISTKRLKSIIEGTECPSDTNSESDVDEIIEHISLDEISSDESVGFMSDDEKNKNKPANKEMTVLELVELQARARAIRSQLALEPVKKEVEDPVLEYSDDVKITNKKHASKDNEEGEVRTSGSEKSAHTCRHSRKRKKSHIHAKRPLSNDNRTRHIELSGKQSLKVNVSFNEQLEKDDDEINLYVSDTEKEELLSETVVNRRESKNSESDISIVDLNNSPLIISSESENDFTDLKEDCKLKEPSIEIKQELIDDESHKSKNYTNKHKDSSAPNEHDGKLSEKIGENNSQLKKSADSLSDCDITSDDEALEENTDWKTRWMNSDKVKKVLVTSKLYSNIKKKQKSSQKSKNGASEIAVKTLSEETPEPANAEITGSVQEFEKLSDVSQGNKNKEIRQSTKINIKEQTGDKTESSI